MSAASKIEMQIVSIVPVDRHAAVTAAPRRTEAGTRLERIWSALVLWHRKREGRRALREMTADQLKDIGLSRSEAAREIGKSFFWD
ncbi:DUF1127 domain-containing protein [Rhizobium binxianense]